MKTKFTFFIILFCLSLSCFSQNEDKKLFKLIESIVQLPEDRSKLLTSCLIILKVDNKDDSIKVLNTIDREYRFIVEQLNSKKSKDQIFSKAKVNSVITISILSISENDSINDNSINIKSPNLLSSLAIYRYFKNCFFYPPICIINQFDYKKKI